MSEAPDMYQDGTKKPQYWYNLKTGKVECGIRSDYRHRMGPYASEDEARQALAIAKRNTQLWDERDRQWKNGNLESEALGE